VKIKSLSEIFNEVKMTATPFFTETTIKKFLYYIRLFRPRIPFFQITQTKKVPTLEFGALTNRVFVDIVLTEDEKFITIIPIPSISDISLLDYKDFTKLEILTVAGKKLSYASFSPGKRQELHNFSIEIQSQLFKTM